MPFVQTLPTFLEDFILEIRRSSTRVFIQSMIIADGDAMKRLEPELIEAKKRGCDVKIHIDWVYTRYYHGHIDIIPQLSKKRNLELLSAQQENQKMLTRFNDNGIEVTIMNFPNLMNLILPISGRNHIKIYITDNVGWLGGLNFYDESFKNFDFMVRFDNPGIVNALVDQFGRIGENKFHEDTSIQITQNEKLMIDSGKRGSSLILDNVVELVKNAKQKVTIVSQMMPEGKLLDAMITAANRGVIVDVVSSYREENMFTTFPYYIPYKRFIKLTKNIQNLNLRHLPHKVHAKLLIIDNNIAVFGSHNFVDTGVKLGTTEIALQTQDFDLIRQLQELIPNSSVSGTIN